MPGTTSRAEIEATASRDQATYWDREYPEKEEGNILKKNLEKDKAANRIIRVKYREGMILLDSQ